MWSFFQFQYTTLFGCLQGVSAKLLEFTKTLRQTRRGNCHPRCSVSFIKTVQSILLKFLKYLKSMHFKVQVSAFALIDPLQHSIINLHAICTKYIKCLLQNLKPKVSIYLHKLHCPSIDLHRGRLKQIFMMFIRVI